MTFTKQSFPVLTITPIALLAAFSSALAKNTLLTNAVVHTVSGPTHSPGFVLIEGDTIKAVGPARKKPDTGEAKVLNLKGQHLFPGLIAPTTALGLMEIAAVRATVDTREVGTYTPEVKSWLAINPDSELIPVARANGITHFLPVPQGGTVTGQSGLGHCRLGLREHAPLLASCVALVLAINEHQSGRGQRQEADQRKGQATKKNR